MDTYVKRRFYFTDIAMNRDYWILEAYTKFDEDRFIWAYNDKTTQINYDKNQITSEPILDEDKSIRINLDHVILVGEILKRYATK